MIPQIGAKQRIKDRSETLMQRDYQHDLLEAARQRELSDRSIEFASDFQDISGISQQHLSTQEKFKRAGSNTAAFKAMKHTDPTYFFDTKVARAANYDP